MGNKRFFVIVAFIFFTGAVFAQSKFAWKQATSGGYTYKYVTNDPMKARFYTLKNGLTVILSPTAKEPRIQCYVAVKAGSKTDPADHTGLAHYLEHMLFKGTDKYGSLDWSREKPQLELINALYKKYNTTTDETLRRDIYRQIDSVSGVASRFAIANEYDKMMSAMGAQGTNAFTSFEQTVYTDDVPASAINKYLAVQSERFRNPVFRIFHTELEAVYEEKNRSLDNDSRKIFETLFAALFKNHNYGKQTTIGTIEHLKNPSLEAIRNYFNTYYVPNNMGIIMSGDFNPDLLIRQIDQSFAFMKERPVTPYKAAGEVHFSNPEVYTVMGPDAESVTIGYRLPGNQSRDLPVMNLIGSILTNGRAGLMDLNLVKKQKLLYASASTFTLIDHGVLYLRGNATKGQSLEEVKNLLLGEIANLKQGNFDDDLLLSIINNEKKRQILVTESYGARAGYLMNAFTNELDWKDRVASADDLSKITKKDITAFANKYLVGDYVVVFKKQGEDKNVVKIDKPPIHPVETNPKAQSDFVKAINKMPESPIRPVWLDYNKDLQKSTAGPAEILYVQNKDNSIFRLRYRYELGTWNDQQLGLAAQYLQFLGTDKLSAEFISKEFYKIACSFSVSAGNEYTTVTLEGIQENMPKAVRLFEDLLANCKPDDQALQSLKARILKSRADAKLNKSAILSGLLNYARYGEKNPFNDVISNADLEQISSAELVSLLYNLNKYPHKILYYGPQSLPAFTASLKSLHNLPVSFTTVPAKKEYKPAQQQTNQVYFTDYDMVQSEIRWVRNNNLYDPEEETVVTVFNNYFGGGMGSLVFQTIRESKALAYSTSAYYVTPSKKEDPYFVTAYVGSQADKFKEATTAMNELLNNLPELPENLTLARTSAKKDLETQRIVQDDIIFNYLGAQQKGLQDDIRKKIYGSIDQIGYKELKDFHNRNLASKPFTYCIVASEKKLDKSELEKLGTVKKIELNEVFGY